MSEPQDNQIGQGIDYEPAEPATFVVARGAVEPTGMVPKKRMLRTNDTYPRQIHRHLTGYNESLKENQLFVYHEKRPHSIEEEQIRVSRSNEGSNEDIFPPSKEVLENVSQNHIKHSQLPVYVKQESALNSQRTSDISRHSEVYKSLNSDISPLSGSVYKSVNSDFSPLSGSVLKSLNSSVINPPFDSGANQYATDNQGLSLIKIYEPPSRGVSDQYLKSNERLQHQSYSSGGETSPRTSDRSDLNPPLGKAFDQYSKDSQSQEPVEIYQPTPRDISDQRHRPLDQQHSHSSDEETSALTSHRSDLTPPPRRVLERFMKDSQNQGPVKNFHPRSRDVSDQHQKHSQCPDRHLTHSSGEETSVLRSHRSDVTPSPVNDDQCWEDTQSRNPMKIYRPPRDVSDQHINSQCLNQHFSQSSGENTSDLASYRSDDISPSFKSESYEFLQNGQDSERLRAQSSDVEKDSARTSSRSENIYPPFSGTVNQKASKLNSGEIQSEPSSHHYFYDSDISSFDTSYGANDNEDFQYRWFRAKLQRMCERRYGKWKDWKIEHKPVSRHSNFFQVATQMEVEPDGTLILGEFQRMLHPRDECSLASNSSFLICSSDVLTCASHMQNCGCDCVCPEDSVESVMMPEPEPQ